MKDTHIKWVSSAVYVTNMKDLNFELLLLSWVFACTKGEEKEGEVSDLKSELIKFQISSTAIFQHIMRWQKYNGESFMMMPNK